MDNSHKDHTGINQPEKVDMPLNKSTKSYMVSRIPI